MVYAATTRQSQLVFYVKNLLVENLFTRQFQSDLGKVLSLRKTDWLNAFIFCTKRTF